MFNHSKILFIFLAQRLGNRVISGNMGKEMAKYPNIKCLLTNLEA